MRSARARVRVYSSRAGALSVDAAARARIAACRLLAVRIERTSGGGGDQQPAVVELATRNRDSSSRRRRRRRLPAPLAFNWQCGRSADERRQRANLPRSQGCGGGAKWKSVFIWPHSAAEAPSKLARALVSGVCVDANVYRLSPPPSPSSRLSPSPQLLSLQK